MIHASPAGVRCRLLVLVLTLALAPVAASAQSWQEALRSGDHTAAADVLHALVSDPDAAGSLDPAAPQALARLYADGLGVPRDPVLACSLAWYAAALPQTTADFSGLAERRATEFRDALCDPLADAQRAEAAGSAGCFIYGARGQTLDLGGRRVRVMRHEVAVDDGPATSRMPVPCFSSVALIRGTTVSPDARALPGTRPRHFVEVFIWVDAVVGNSPERALQWQVYEVGEGVVPLPAVTLLHAPGRAWMRPPMPPGIDAALTLEMIRSGQVRWRLAGPKPRHGWFLLPTGEAPS